MMLWLVTKRKQKFINGKVAKPKDENSEEFEAWETVNGVVFSWIINACEKNIAATIRSADSAADAWNILKVRYSQRQAPLRFQIGHELTHLFQGDMSVIITSNLSPFGTSCKILAKKGNVHVMYVLVV